MDSNLGKEAVRSTVTDEVVNESFPLAVDENNLFMISQPKFGDVEGLVEEGKDFTFSAEFEVKPELELSDYSPVHVEIPFKTASELEIDEQINSLGDYYFDYKNAPANTKVKEKSIVELTMTVKDDNGEAIDALGVEDRMYELGQGMFPAAFDEALIGMKKGETKSITLNVEENPCMVTSFLKEKTENATFDVEIKVVKKKVAPKLPTSGSKRPWASLTSPSCAFAWRVHRAAEGRGHSCIMENNALYALQSAWWRGFRVHGRRR
ncbi:MAG: trigger factor [Eggerthellaceae bacterium]